MQRPQRETLTLLEDILITEELSHRTPRTANFISENQALHALVRQLVNQPETMLQNLAQMALELCQCGTAGVSLLETTPSGEEIFRWNVLAGTLSQCVGGTTPRNFSPCGICLDRGTPVLFSHPERYFIYLQEANTTIVEGLVLPLIADNHALGTIWIMSHDRQRHFDSEDVRVMTSLADLTAVALLLNQRQAQELLAKNAQPEALIGERHRQQAKADKSASDALLSADFIERALAEKAWHDSEEKYHTLFDSIDEGYCVIEMHIEPGEPLDYRFIATNQAFEKQSTLFNAQGKWMRQLKPNHEESWFEIYRDVALTGEPIRFEHGGRELENRWFTVYAFRIGEPNKHQVAVLFNDITERKQVEQAKTLFLSNVSHEFRTPLTLLLSPLQDALSDSANPLPQAQQERLELAHRNSLRLLKLVNTLLDFSRIEAGRMEAVYEPTDLALYTTELASVFRSAIEQAGLQLSVDCPPISELVYVDREMWEKIVLNLLSNAFKFTLEGEIAVRVYLEDGDHVTLQVEDTGTGIEPEELPHLFERFYQVKRATARTYEGSGIGLALVHELIKIHGGTIEVSSTPRVGSCFTVTILLGTAHLQSDRLRRVVGDRITATRTLRSTALNAAPYVQQAERWISEKGTRDWGIGTGKKLLSREPGAEEKNFPNTQSPVPNLHYPLSSEAAPPSPIPHVLIVDDNADMRDYLKRILSEHNVEVEAVADGAAALAIVTERVPSLVVSDVMMPLLDGFELLKALRADAQTKEVPIILLSARAGEESVIEGLLAGADDYLIKPFSATELVTRVLAHLQMAQLRSQALHQQKTINRMKDKFLAEVSHELNTPLVAILGWTRLLRSSQPSQTMLMKSLETIERNATLQAKLVQDLLDISRIAAGKVNLNLQPVELQEVIEAAIAIVHHSLEAKEILFNCTLDSLPRIVQGDPDRLQQIVLNLLTNAIKFTSNGGRIKISLEAVKTQAQIVLTDTGCGIDAEFMPYIFDTFRQAKGAKKGLGLGLAIARNFVELHGGTIYAQSPGVGQGTTFIVNLLLSGNSI
ncbi:ATP-binding protein [Nostoc sp.]|uniref:ATP-binding protein n=1 Tax=Nostoc sp. TaxID=1180 RepID=UPI002FFCF94F